MALNECVQRILCGLSAGALQALGFALDALVVQNNIAIAALQARAAALSLKLVPLELARAGVEAALRAAQEASRMLPLALIADCADLGDLNTLTRQAIEREVAAVFLILDDINRLLSIQNELAALIGQLTRLNDLIAEIKGVIAECGT